MTSRQDVQKRRVWGERLVRYRASGLTVARFCVSERVSINTFYYWAKRVGAGAIASSSGPRSDVSPLRGATTRLAYGVAEPASPALVRFHFNATVEVSVPVDCLEAIRCLVDCVRDARKESSGAFQEVIVAAR